MKRLFILSLLSILLIPCFSQIKLTNSVDSVTASTTAYSSSLKQSGNWDYITLQITYAKSGGTLDFYAIPQGSVDNIGWFNLSKDTAKSSNVTSQTYGWQFDKRRVQYYRIATTTTSTAQGFKPTAYIFAGSPPGK